MIFERQEFFFRQKIYPPIKGDVLIERIDVGQQSTCSRLMGSRR